MSLVFPAIQALQKVSNHLTLLIPPKDDKDEAKRESSLKKLQISLPDHWRTLYKNRNSIHTFANPEFCGKWKILKKLLSFWHQNKDKVLVFSHSVRLLDILQSLFRSTSYSVSFLNGHQSYEERQQEVDTFNTDPHKFVFLISTKAGGVGLNITSANKVVIFDPHWNPSYVCMILPRDAFDQLLIAIPNDSHIRIYKPKTELIGLANCVMSRFSVLFQQARLKKLFTLARFTNSNKPISATMLRMSVATSKVYSKIKIAKASFSASKTSSPSTQTKSYCKAL